MYCTKCGKQIRDGSNFCGFCGARITRAEKKETGNSAVIEDVQKKVSQVYRENAPKVKDAIGMAGEKAGQIYQENAPKVKEALNNVGEKASQIYQENAPRVRQALGNAGETINEKTQDISKKISSADPEKKNKARLIITAAACIALVFLVGKLIFGTGRPSMKSFENQAEKYARKNHYDLSEIYYPNVDDDTFWGISNGLYYLAYDYMHTKERALIAANTESVDFRNLEVLYGEFLSKEDARRAFGMLKEGLEYELTGMKSKDYKYITGVADDFYSFGLYLEGDKMLLFLAAPDDTADAINIARKCGFSAKY